MVDYSRWKDIDVSDDEDDTHPNIDTPYLFRLRHESRVIRMQEMEEEREALQKKKEELKERKKELDRRRLAGEEDVSDLEKSYDSEAQELSNLENAFNKKERLNPWNVDTLSEDGFSKTVINSKPKPNQGNSEEESEEEKAKRLSNFIKEHKPLLKKFGMLRKFEDSKRFLMDHPELVCEETVDYLVLWCLDLAMEQKMELMNHVSHQFVSIRFLLQVAKELDRDPRGCVSSFFTRMSDAKQTTEFSQQAFDIELKLFREKIRKRAEEKLKKLVEEQEERDRKARLGPGGLDPLEVFETLPDILKKCFEAKDIPMLQKALQEMDEKDARYHLERCADSGLWCPSKEDLEEPKPQPQARYCTIL